MKEDKAPKAKLQARKPNLLDAAREILIENGFRVEGGAAFIPAQNLLDNPERFLQDIMGFV